MLLLPFAPERSSGSWEKPSQGSGYVSIASIGRQGDLDHQKTEAIAKRRPPGQGQAHALREFVPSRTGRSSPMTSPQAMTRKSSIGSSSPFRTAGPTAS